MLAELWLSVLFEFYGKALNIWQHLPGPAGFETAGAYFNMGTVHEARGDVNSAVQFNDKELKILKNIPPPSTPQAADLYCSLGSYFGKQLDFGKALDCIQQARRIRLNFFQEDHHAITTLNTAVVALEKAIE